MEFVHPIKSIEKISQMKEILKKHSIRDLLLFVAGINLGIRVQDLLNLKLEDVYDVETNSPREFLVMYDATTGKKNYFYINEQVSKVLMEYIKAYDLQSADFLFKSKKNDSPITRQQAYRIINGAAKEIGLDVNIGMHTLRKTFGYHAYRKGIAISILMDIFHHSTHAETLNYIGIDKKEVLPIRLDVNL